MRIRRCCARGGAMRDGGRRSVGCGGAICGARRATTARRRPGTDLHARCVAACDNMKIQSYLTAAAVNLKRLSAALAANLLALWRAWAAREEPLRVHHGHKPGTGFVSAAA